MYEYFYLKNKKAYEMLRRCRQIIMDNPRKGRLFAVACCHRIWHRFEDRRSRDAVTVATRHADGLASDEELSVAAGAAQVAHREAFAAKGKVGACAEWAAEFTASSSAWFAAR